MAQLLDPVCGMTVEDTAVRAAGYVDVAFCSPGCRTAFLKDPDAFPARLNDADPVPKQCTCGKQENLICRCDDGHDDSGHAGHGHAGHGHHDSGHAGHDHVEHSGSTREPVASGSGCCGGHGG